MKVCDCLFSHVLFYCSKINRITINEDNSSEDIMIVYFQNNSYKNENQIKSKNIIKYIIGTEKKNTKNIIDDLSISQ